jgi:hypothetical protein
VEHIRSRRNKRLKAKQNANDRLHNPLIAAQSAPGGGKTTFINHFAEFIEQNSSSDLAFIPVLVTFNSGTSASELDQELQTAGLVLRMICR